MKTFYIQEKDGKPLIYKDIIDDEEGLRIFGKSPDHYTPMKIINEFLGVEALSMRGNGLMIHLWLPEKHMQLWSDKIGSNQDLQTEDGLGFRLDKMQ